MKNIAIFDFDKTITSKDSFNDFLIYSFGKSKFIFGMIKNLPYIFLYKLNKIKNYEIKNKMLETYFKKTNYDEYTKLCENYVNNRLNKIIRKDINEIIKDYKENNFELVLLSASFKEWLKPWAEENGFDKIICSKFEINNNKIGKIKKENSCYGKNKLTKLLKEYPNIQENYNEILCYGDSKSDYHFMNIGTSKYLVTNKNILLLDEYGIITDGLWRKSISAIRSIGKKGIKVTVTGDTYLTVGMWSRYCSKKKKITNASTDPNIFGENLLEILKSRTVKPVLFPMEEPTVLWCTKHYEEISRYCYLLLPSKESMEIALSKAETIKKAMSVKVPCPKTYFPKNAKEIETIIKKEKLKDYVIKPYHGSGSAGLLYGKNSKDVNLEEHWKKYGELIIQERIDETGEGVGVSIIMDKLGEVKGIFSHKRLEQYPNSGGPSTQRIGIKNKKLIDDSIKLLKSLNWKGVAMVEWKYNPNTNEYVLMEINPRFWGSLELAVRCGVDFPFIYYQLSKDRYIKSSLDFDTTKVLRWLIPGDVLRYITKKDRESLFKFCKGMFKDSEEWDKKDKRGFFATIICQGLLIINPKYWKYIRK